MDIKENYSNFSITEEFKREVIEHGVKIKNIEGIVVDTDKKIDTLSAEIQQIRVLIAANTPYNPVTCEKHGIQIKEFEKAREVADIKIADLVASKNRIIGAMSFGAFIGSIFGAIGTWVVMILSSSK
jgi:hypothetical protein